jgi:hypothetical protein
VADCCTRASIFCASSSWRSSSSKAGTLVPTERSTTSLYWSASKTPFFWKPFSVWMRWASSSSPTVIPCFSADWASSTFSTMRSITILRRPSCSASSGVMPRSW